MLLNIRIGKMVRCGSGILKTISDYMTQGESTEELQENLKDIYQEFISGTIPSIRHVAELAVA